MTRYLVEAVSEDLVRLWQVEPEGEVDPFMLTPGEDNLRFAELLKLDGKQIEVDLEKKTWKTV